VRLKSPLLMKPSCSASTLLIKGWWILSQPCRRSPMDLCRGEFDLFNRLKIAPLQSQGPITRDRGTQFGDGEEEAADHTVFSIFGSPAGIVWVYSPYSIGPIARLPGPNPPPGRRQDHGHLT